MPTAMGIIEERKKAIMSRLRSVRDFVATKASMKRRNRSRTRRISRAVPVVSTEKESERNPQASMSMNAVRSGIDFHDFRWYRREREVMTVTVIPSACEREIEKFLPTGIEYVSAEISRDMRSIMRNERSARGLGMRRRVAMEAIPAGIRIIGRSDNTTTTVKRDAVVRSRSQKRVREGAEAIFSIRG